jgi:acetyltransferase
MGTENLAKIFDPKRIAIIGATDREGSLGAKLLQNLVGVGYDGAVYPVNPFRPTIQGVTAYPSITKIPWKVDLAVIATPAHTVPQIIDECGKAGVPGVIIVSAGFGEVGKEGEDLEKQILAYKNQYNMRIIGPNSFGVMRPRIRLNATFSVTTAIPGKIAFISQSAALCSSALDWASEAHIGFSAVVSAGSMLDVDLGDFIDYFGTDPYTKSIVLYIENIKDARKFMSASRGFARTKPIVVVKAGRFPACVDETLSQTDALCSEDAVHDAAFRRAGIVRVEAVSDLFSCAKALAMQPNPKGANLTIITNGRGPGIIAADCVIARGARLSPLADETGEALKSVLPSYCSITNPVDVLEEATPDRFKKVMEICLKDPNSDGLLIIYTPQGAADPFATAKIIVELSMQTTKPLLTSLICRDACSSARHILEENRVPAFSTPEEAVSAFMCMYSYTQNLELLYQTPEELSLEFSIPIYLKEVLRRAFNEGRTVLSQPEALSFLKAYNIQAIETLVAATPDEAETIASELGYPVVMKTLFPQKKQRSNVVRTILNVWSAAEVKNFFRELTEQAEHISPKPEHPAVAIQPMVRNREYELRIASTRDPLFGQVILFGTGGVSPEILKDVSIGFPPLNQVLARRLMERTAIFKSLESGGQSSNIKLLEETIIKFSQLVIDFPEIREIDINPLIVSERSATAVNARIVIDREKMMMRQAQPHEHLVIAPYPKKYVSQWKMKDGTTVLLRPIKPEDEILFNALFKSLTEETMRLRFFQIIKELSHETLTRYCNLDYDREIAIVAELQKDERKIVGVARLILEPNGKSGEFAVVVGDQWQGLGLGSKLIDYIVDVGRDMALSQVFGHVISSNYRMVDLCARKGFKMEPAGEVTRATFQLA